MKGSLEGILPMLGLLLTAIILTVQTIPIGEAFNSVVGESSEDIENLVETRTAYDYTVEHYIPSSLEYSVNNAAYELDDGGINWESEASSALTPNSIVRSVVDEWEDETISRMDDRLEEAACLQTSLSTEVYPGDSEPGFDYFSTEFEEVTTTTRNFGGLDVSCNSETEYSTGIYSERVSTPNRYVELAKASSRFFFDVEDEDMPSYVDDEYTATSRECGSYDVSGARSDARSAYYSDVFDVSNIESGISVPSGISIDSSQDDEYDGSHERRSGSQCNEECDGEIKPVPPEFGGEPGETYCDGTIITEDWKYVDYTVEPEYSSIDFEAADDEVEVLAEGSYNNLNILIEDYRINY